MHAEETLASADGHARICAGLIFFRSGVFARYLRFCRSILFFYYFYAFSGFGSWKEFSNAWEKEVSTDVNVFCCEVDKRRIQFPIRISKQFHGVV